MMRRTSRRTVAALMGLALLGGAARAEPQAVLVIESVDAVLGKVAYLMAETAPEAGVPADVGDLKAMLATGPMAGIDFTRPIGAFGSLPALPEGLPQATVAIPLIDLDDLLATIRGFGGVVEREREAPGFTHRVTFAGLDAMPLFLVATRDYAFLSPFPVAADELARMRLEDWLPQRPDLGDVSLTVALDRLPPAFTDSILAAVEAEVRESAERLPGESAMEARGRRAGTALVATVAKSLVRDAATLALDIAVDRDAGTIALAGRLSARPGTRLADSLTAFGQLRSRFADIAPEAPLSAWMAVPVPEEIRDLIWDAFEEGARDGPEPAGGDRRSFEQMLEVAEGVIRRDVQDAGIALLGPAAEDDTYALALAAGIIGGRKADSLFKEFVAAAGGDVVKTDAGRAPDGTSLHRLRNPAADDLLSQRIYGAADGWLGLREDILAVGFGANAAGREAAARGLAAATGTGGSDAPIGGTLRLTGLAPLAEVDNAAAGAVAAAEQAFRGAAAGRDRVRFALGGRRGDLRVTGTIDVPALRFFFLIGSRLEAEAVGQP